MKIRKSDIPVDLISKMVKYDSYDIIKEVFSGTESTISIGKDILSLKTVIINKCEKNSKFSDQKSFINFLSIISKINNPFILRMLGFTVHWPFCIITDVFDGRNLYDMIRSNNLELTGTNKTIIAISLANALLGCHRRSLTVPCLTSRIIYLSEHMRPMLSISEVYARRAPSYVAPELHETYETNTKTDIFLLAFVFFHLLTGEEAFSGITNKNIKVLVANRRRPLLPKDTPAPLANLIRRMWAHSPSDRPTDEQVIRELEGGKILFPNSELHYVQSYVQKIMNARRRTKEKINRNEYYISKTLLSNYSNEAADSAILKYIENIPNIIQNDQYMSIYQLLSTYLKPCTPLKLTKATLRTIYITLNSVDAYEAFEKLKISSLLPYDEPNFTEDVFNILHKLFENAPECVSNISKTLSLLASKNPEKTIVLLAYYARHFPKNPYPVLDTLLQSALSFLRSKSGAEYVSILYFLCTNHKIYVKKRFDQIRPIIVLFLSSKDQNAARAAYSFLYYFFDEEYKLNFDQIIQDISNTVVSNDALSILLKMKEIPHNKELIYAVISICHISENAFLVLMRIISNAESAEVVANDLSFMESLAISEALKIMLHLLKHRHLRKTISTQVSTLNLLINLTSSYDKNNLVCLNAVVKNLQFTTSAFTYLSQSNFFNSVFRNLMDSSDEGPRVKLLETIAFLAKNGYTKEFDSQIEGITRFCNSETKTLSESAFFALFYLSFHRPCAEEMKRLNIKEDVMNVSRINVTNENVQTLLDNIDI